MRPRALRPNTFASREERLAEQSFRLEVSFTGGEKQPPDCLPTVLVDASAVEMHACQIVLGVCIAEIGRGELEHLESTLRIGTYFAVGYSIQIIDPYCVKGARHDREVAPVRVVLVVIADNLREIVISLFSAACLS